MSRKLANEADAAPRRIRYTKAVDDKSICDLLKENEQGKKKLLKEAGINCELKKKKKEGG